jgi:hypothetical protein
MIEIYYKNNVTNINQLMRLTIYRQHFLVSVSLVSNNSDLEAISQKFKLDLSSFSKRGYRNQFPLH